jgi:hypothetical protein
MSHPARRFVCAGLAVAVTAVTLVAADRPPALSTVILRPDATPPVLAGDVFNYSATSTTTITSIFSPNPIVEKSTLDETIKAAGPFTFNRHPNLTRLEYTFPGDSTLTEAVYVGFVPGSGATEEVVYGSETTDSLGTPAEPESTVSTQTYPVGGIESVFPEAAGQHWSPAATSTTVSTETGKPVNSKSTITDFADGSSTTDSTTVDAAATPVLTSTVKESIASNGTATETQASTGANLETVTVGLPAAQHGKFLIPVKTVGGNPLPAKPTTSLVEVPDWYPSHDAPPKPLLSSEVIDKGLVTTPAACGKRAGFKAFDLHGESAKLDPFDATYLTTTLDEYDMAGLGPVCTISEFKSYDYGDSAFETGKLIGTATTATVMILTSESGPKPLFSAAGGAQPFSLGFTFPDRLQPRIGSFTRTAGVSANLR